MSTRSRIPLTQLKTHSDAAPALIQGRVVACSSDERSILLADASGSMPIIFPEVEHVRPGDWLEILCLNHQDQVVAQEVRLLVPYRGTTPFPAPDGEYSRLHSGRQHRAELLALRSRCLAAIRCFFLDRGYLEVQTPLRVRCPGLEPHLCAEKADEDGYLITSPEYQMKRLLAGGLERIFFLGPCWRGDETGAHHLREFTMLEWYQAFLPLEALMAEVEALLFHLAREIRGTERFSYQGEEQDWRLPFRRLSFAQAFQQHAGIEIEGVVDPAQLRQRAIQAGFEIDDPDARFEEITSQILVERIEPALEGPQPVFLHDYPAPLAALAQLKPDQPHLSERFELYAGGLELANAFGELTDPSEQLCRLQQDQAARRESGSPVYEIDQRFISALAEGIPPSSGIALGVDRLIMLLADAAHIREVVAFGPEEI